MKKIIIILMLIPIFCYAASQSTSNYDANSYFGSGSSTVSLSTYNISSGTSQIYISNFTGTNFMQLAGIFYIVSANVNLTAVPIIIPEIPDTEPGESDPDNPSNPSGVFDDEVEEEIIPDNATIIQQPTETIAENMINATKEIKQFFEASAKNPKDTVDEWRELSFREKILLVFGILVLIISITGAITFIIQRKKKLEEKPSSKQEESIFGT